MQHIAATFASIRQWLALVGNVLQCVNKNLRKALVAWRLVMLRDLGSCLLQQATELSAHFARVKSVFAEGDLQRIAATLASIRQGLALVGNVPEFRGGSGRLEVRNPLPCSFFVGVRMCLLLRQL